MIKLLTPLEFQRGRPMKNRFMLAPLTNWQSHEDGILSDEEFHWLTKRAQCGFGLTMTCAAHVQEIGKGFPGQLGAFGDQHIEGLSRLAEAIKSEGSLANAQLHHAGMRSPEEMIGQAPVSASDDEETGARALSTGEVRQLRDDFIAAAVRCDQAGFDGVELHMGHGYLVDQFLDAQVNDRIDEYGGSIENRCRFAIELLERIISRIGAEHVMVRISPSRVMGDLYEWPDLYEMLDYLIAKFKSVGLRQLDVSCANADYFITSGKIIRYIRKQWPYLIVGGASLQIEDANKEIEDGFLDLVTWGRAILANPDFVSRVNQNVELLPFDNAMRDSLI